MLYNDETINKIDQNKLYSLLELSKILGLTKQGINYWFKSNNLKHTLIGRCKFVHGNDVISFLNEHKKEKTIKIVNGLTCLCCNEVTKYTNFSNFFNNHIKMFHNDIKKPKDYYDLYINLNRFCDTCGKEKSFISVQKGYHKHCSDIKCRLSCPEIKEKLFNHTDRDVIVEKMKKTKIDRYGDPFYVNKKKAEETSINRYGVSNFTNREKAKQTSIEKYGVDNVLKLPEFYNKALELRKQIQQSTNQKIGERRREKFKIVLDDFCKEKNYTLIKYEDRNVQFKCAHEHVFDINTSLLFSRRFYNSEVCTLCNPVDRGYSLDEKEIVEYIKELGITNIEENNKTVLNGLELDIYLPDYNIAIEFNGIFWHSTTYKDNQYHLNKTNMCTQLGVRLIHIFEDEWKNKKDIIKDRIKNCLQKIDKKIYARNCICKEISSIEAENFLNKNHIQGFVVGQTYIGLFNNDTLIATMVFGRSKFNNKYCCELSRYATILNNIAVGGASKLLNFYVQKYNPENIVSYADLSWSTGNLYDKLGFIVTSISKPTYFYVDSKYNRYNRFKFRKDELKKMGYDTSNKTEDEITKSMGIFKIYNCGIITYVKDIIP